MGPETANIREPNLTVLERGTTRSPCAAKIIRGWMSVTDRGLTHMRGFSAKVRVTLTDDE